MSFGYLTFIKHLWYSFIIIFFGAFLYFANTEFPVGLALGKSIMVIGSVFLFVIVLRLKRYLKEEIEVDINQK